jgi:hypothetical protein
MYLTAILSGRDDISVQQPVSIMVVSEKSANTAYPILSQYIRWIPAQQKAFRSQIGITITIPCLLPAVQFRALLYFLSFLGMAENERNFDDSV